MHLGDSRDRLAAFNRGDYGLSKFKALPLALSFLWLLRLLSWHAVDKALGEIKCPR